MPDSTNAFASDVLAGLAPIHPQSKRIAPKYFYDAYGSALFDRICQLPEYYPTRTELRILSTHASEIASLLGSGVDIVEFGAGSLTKIRLLLNAFAPDARPRRFVPIDISGEHLLHAVSALKAEFPDLAVEPVVADYMAIRSLPSPLYRPVGFFPGSTIGNLEIDEARQFLGHAATLLRGGGLLVGVDLVKPPALLHAAYNDREGITAEFNLNLLRRINRELDGNFDLKQFSHYAFYHPARHRIEMHLVSRAAQQVSVMGKTVQFAEGEAIHTENSHKFTVAGFQALAADAGFLPSRVWTDPDKLFSVHWLKAPARAHPGSM